MNRKEIITADLCGRLIHGVKAVLTCDWTEDFDGEIDEEHLQEGSVWTISGYSGDSIPLGDGDLDGLLFTKENSYASFGMNGGWKPLLFSSLTEPITVAGYNDGLPFIPIVELFHRMKYAKEVCIVDSYSSEDGIHELRYRLDEVGSITGRFVFNQNQCCFALIENGKHRLMSYQGNGFDLLNQWHCNYRLLPGEFIPATNEYA